MSKDVECSMGFMLANFGTALHRMITTDGTVAMLTEIMNLKELYICG